MFHNRKNNRLNQIHGKQSSDEASANTGTVAVSVLDENQDGTSSVDTVDIPTGSTTINESDPDTVDANLASGNEEKTGFAVFLGFKCTPNDGCTTSVYEKKVESPDRCAKACLDKGANAGSYVSLNSNACRNTDPYIPGNTSYYPDNMLGSCLCYTNATYTPDNYINDTYLDDYKLFRIG